MGMAMSPPPTRRRAVARAVARRPAGPPVCQCRPGPYILVTFRHEQLISVERKHNRLSGSGNPHCRLATEQLDPIAWLEGRA